MNNLSEVRPGSAFIQQGPVTLSPASETFSHTHNDPSRPRTSTPQASTKRAGGASNGYGLNAPPSSTTPRRLKNAFDLFCNEMRSMLMVNKRAELAAGTYDLERGLAEGWRSLNDTEKAGYQQRFERQKKGLDAEKETEGGQDADHGTPTPTGDAARQVTGDEDVEMEEPPSSAPGEP